MINCLDIYNKKEITFKNITQFINYCMKENAQLEIKDKNLQNLYKFLNYYKVIKNKCETRIKDYNVTLLENEKNNIVKDLLNDFVDLNSDGKYLRATLVALGYHSLKENDDYLPLALALEVFQTSILIHDDIIDKADMRRGKKTIPVKYKEKMKKNLENNIYKEKKEMFANSMALCMGDLGFYLANKIILDNYKDSSNLANILAYYNNMAIKTNKGEIVDVYLPFIEENFSHEFNLEEKIFEIYELKTAWYSVVGPFCLGLVLAGADNKIINEIEKILIDLGVAFQIKDDLIGIYTDENKTGKTSSDVLEYKQTLLYSYTINTKYKDELLKYYGTNNTSKVAEIFEKSGAKKYAIDKMECLFKSVISNIKKINLSEEQKNILCGFAYFLKEREK